MTTKTMPHEKPTLKLERVFNATPERLWTFWTDPKKYAKWFAPAPGQDLEIHEFDARPGGKIRFEMPHGDGQSHEETGVFHSLTPYTEIVSGAPDKSFLLTVRFRAMTAKMTNMSVEVVGVPAEYHEMATKGWNSGFDKLEHELGAGSAMPKTSGPNVGFTIERTFRAPPEKVWKLWTTKEGIESWWRPAAKEMGMELRVLKLDVRVGGEYEVEMKDEKVALLNHGKYVDVQPNRRLAQQWHFDIFLAPGEAAYEVAITIDLEPVAGGTKMTFKQGPLATAEHTEGSREGVGRNLDQMAKVLER